METDRDRLVETARRILRSRADAEDAVHDVYLRSYAHDAPPSAPDAWLTTAVRHAAIDRVRARTRRQRLGTALPDTDGPSPDAERAAETASEVELALDALLGRVGPHTAALWLLREVFDVEHATLAAALGSTEAGSRQAAQRARRAVETPRTRRRSEPTDDDFLAVCRHALATGEAGALLAFVATRPTAHAAAAHGAPSARVPAVAGGSPTGPRISQQLAFVDGRCVLTLRCGDAVLCVVPLGPSEDLRAEA